MSKCDLHIHSRFSARSEEWLFRRFDFPDSYSDPRELHRQLLEREMDFVTITDHDTIDGCLEIRDLPNTFISEQVWKIILVGGSDDHGGQFIASVFTETPRADSTDTFLERIRAAKCQAHGHGGTPLALSHGFYNTVALFIQDHFHEKLGPSAALVEQMFSRFMEGRDPTELTLAEKASLFGQAVRSGKIFELFKPANVSLWKELSI